MVWGEVGGVGSKHRTSITLRTHHPPGIRVRQFAWGDPTREGSPRLQRPDLPLGSFTEAWPAG